MDSGANKQLSVFIKTSNFLSCYTINSFPRRTVIYWSRLFQNLR